MELPDLHIITGETEPPIWARQHIERWRQYTNVLPWTWAELESEIGPPFIDFCERVASPRYRANFARHWLLYLRGGAYADWDTEPVKDPFRIPEWGDHFVIAPHPRMIPWCDNCFMWVGQSHHPVAKKIIDHVDFTRLTAKQITRLTASDARRLRLPLPWNRDRDTGDAIIQHYYMSASLDAREMQWLLPLVRGKKVVEAGCGLRSLELGEVCDLTSIEHQQMFYDRVTRGGGTVILEEDLKKYPKVFARVAKSADLLLIDGRRRVSCFEAVAKKGIPVILHDSNRARYELPPGWKVEKECPASERGLIYCSPV